MTSVHHCLMYCLTTVCYQLLQASSSGFCLPQTTFLHPLCGSFRRPGKKYKRLTSTPRASYACVVASMCTSARCICSNRAFPVSRTLETLLAVFWEAFSLFARRSQVVDFPLHQRASICSSCLTTARRASCATSYATPSVWTRASSSPNSVASGQSFAGGVVLGSLKRARGSAYLDRSLSHQRSTTKDLQTLLLSLLKTGRAPAQLKSTPSHRSGGKLFLQHNPIFSISLCHSKCSTCHVFNLMKYRYTVARSLFLRLNRIILGSNAPILSELESNTDAMQAIRHVVDSLEWSQAMRR